MQQHAARHAAQSEAWTADQIAIARQRAQADAEQSTSAASASYAAQVAMMKAVSTTDRALVVVR